MNVKLLLVLSLVISMVGCSPKIYTAGDFGQALSKHKVVAILPGDVTMQLRPNQMRQMKPGEMDDLTAKTGRDIQEKMYGWFLRRSDKFHYTVTFQDVSRTNAILSKAGISAAILATTDKAELARLLGVDAVLQNRSRMEKPMSEGAAVAVGVLVGAWGATNKVETTINIHDGGTGNLLWKYDYEASGSVGSSTTRLVDNLMRNASKKFPYKS